MTDNDEGVEATQTVEGEESQLSWLAVTRPSPCLGLTFHRGCSRLLFILWKEEEARKLCPQCHISARTLEIMVKSELKERTDMACGQRRGIPLKKQSTAVWEGFS